MSKHISETPATAHLKALGIAYTAHVYDYVEHGGTAESARQLCAPEHAIIKTLVMQDDAAKPLIILMHGDCTVSTKNLARCIQAKKIEPCSPEVAQRHTAYQVGGTSPFGIKKAIPLYLESSILALPSIFINGGRRGYLVQINPQVLVTALGARTVDCALIA
jgi:Cys-tRNA(Pro) deacylase